MNRQEKLNLIEEVIDLEEGMLSEAMVLSDLEGWDSVAALSLIVMLDEKFGKSISGQQVKELKTVNDIMLLME